MNTIRLYQSFPPKMKINYDHKAVGQRLKEFREFVEKKNKTDFAEPCGLTQADIYQLEIGRNKKIMDKVNIILANYTNLDRSWLLYGTKSAGLKNAEKLTAEHEEYLKTIEELKKQIRDKDELLDFYRKQKKG